MLRLAHGPVNAMDLELCQAASRQLRGAGRGPGPGGGADRGRAGLLRRASTCAATWTRGAPYVERFLPALSELFRAAFDLAKPVVAAVNGHAIAGGCVLAACADRTLMAEGNGRIGVPELMVGVPFPRVGAGGAAARGRRGRGAPAGVRRADPPARRRGPGHRAGGRGGAGRRAAAAGGRAARALATEIPADTFAATKSQLRREARRADRTATPTRTTPVATLWSRRATDGWTADYLPRSPVGSPPEPCSGRRSPRHVAGQLGAARGQPRGRVGQLGVPEVRGVREQGRAAGRGFAAKPSSANRTPR